MDEICAIAERENIDAVLIAGDLFDTFNPSTEATELFYRTLKRLSNNGKRPVIAIAGNHDSPDRIEAPDPLARACGILFAGYPDSLIPTFGLDTGLKVLRSAPGFIELQLPLQAAPLRILLTPYPNEQRLRKSLDPLDPSGALRNALHDQWKHLADTYCDGQGVNILMAHLFMVTQGDALPEEPEDERPILVGNAGVVYTNIIPPQIQYTSLGHLHRHQNMGGHAPAIYSSSPLAYSFSEAGQAKRVCIIEAQPGQPVQVQSLILQSGYPLVKMRFEDTDSAVEWLQANPDCYVELTLVTDAFIQSADRKRMMDAHPRMIGPIPMLRDQKDAQATPKHADPSRGREDLFKEYFQHKKGVPPSDNLVALFREVLAGEGAQ